MCRMLFVKSEYEFNPYSFLENFAAICKNSKEYQGHGWGITYLYNGKRKIYKNINPIWDNEFSKFPDTSVLLAHARSAFMDSDIVIENNMPFQNNEYTFTFNGELHGVKIKAPGRIGAEKIFNYILRYDNDDMHLALTKAANIIKKRSTYIKAMNIFVTDFNKLYLASL